MPLVIRTVLGYSQSMIGTILKGKVRIMEPVNGPALMKATIIAKPRSGLIIEMGRLLIIWLDNQNQHNMPISLILSKEAFSLI